MQARLMPSLSMRARWVLIVLVPLAGVAVAWMLLKRPPLTEAVCDQVRCGMTEEEVIKLLGGPATNYGDAERLLLPVNRSGGYLVFDHVFDAEWFDSNWYIRVVFVYDGNPAERPPIEQLRRLVGSGRNPHAHSMKVRYVQDGPMPSFASRCIGGVLRFLWKLGL
jgi:hypothetical protein